MMAIGLVGTAVLFTFGMWYWGGRVRPDPLDAARAELDKGNTTRAEHMLQTALIHDRKKHGDGSERVRAVMELLGQTLARAGEADRAVEILRGMRGQEGLLAEMLLREGLELYHDKREDRGRKLLEEALTLVPEDAPQAKMANEHLGALDKKGRQCRCDSRAKQLGDQVTKIVQAGTPAGLVERVAVRLLGTTMELQVGFGREPANEDEVQAVQTAMRAALDEVQAAG